MTRTRIFAAAAVVASVVALGGTLDVSAQSVDILIPIDEVKTGPPGSIVQLAQVEVDEAFQGVPCTLEITALNQESVHPGNDIIFDSGPTSIAFFDVEGTPFQEYSETDDVVLGSQIVLSVRFGEDQFFSAGFHAIIDCETPTDTVPATTVPDTTIPDTTPDSTTPDTTPESTTPDTTPDSSTPDTTDVPATTIDLTPTSSPPATTFPAATVPDGSVPVDTPPVATLPAPTVPSPIPTTMPPVVLPDTGAETSSTVMLALASLIGGLGLLAVARRRSTLG